MVEAVRTAEKALGSVQFASGPREANSRKFRRSLFVVEDIKNNDAARSPYGTSPNSPIQTSILPVSMPGWEAAADAYLPLFWQPEPTLEHRATGR